MQFLNHKLRLIQGAVVLGLGSLVGCTAGGNNPGIEYAPNMYISEAYEAYTQAEEMKYNPHGMTMRIPVNGTVARGQMDYTMYPEGYDSSASWVNPVAATEANVAEGGRLYNIYCQHCHGKSGKNDGGVIKSGQFPPIPWEGYQSATIKELPDGKAFHSITYGKGNMGAHGSVLTPEERWKVLHYVRSLSLGDDFKYAEAELDMGEGTEDAKGEQMTYGKYDLDNSVSAADLDMINRELEHVLFGGAGSFKFEENSQPHLDKIADYMKAHQGLKALVEGFVANKKDIVVIDKALSTKRAKEVCKYLVSQGVAEDRLIAEGKGNDDMAAKGDSEEAKEKNRRVEIHFIK